MLKTLNNTINRRKHKNKLRRNRKYLKETLIKREPCLKRQVRELKKDQTIIEYGRDRTWASLYWIDGEMIREYSFN